MACSTLILAIYLLVTKTITIKIQREYKDTTEVPKEFYDPKQPEPTKDTVVTLMNETLKTASLDAIVGEGVEEVK